MSDHTHFFRGDAPCACGMSLQEVQAQGAGLAVVANPEGEPAKPTTARPPAVHSHIFTALNEPCKLCGLSYEDAQAEGRPPPDESAAKDKERIAELELELELKRRRLELLEYLHSEAVADGDNPLPSDVRSAIRAVAMHGTTLVAPELLDALIAELQLAAAQLRQHQQSRKLLELERGPVVVE